MKGSVVAVVFLPVLASIPLTAQAERHPGAREFQPLVGSSLGESTPPPRTVTPPGDYALSIDGDFNLGGFVFKENAPFLHNDGGMTAYNTALGLYALVSSTPGEPYGNSGKYNTAVGAAALRNNTHGLSNTAVGFEALKKNTTTALIPEYGAFQAGSYNTATGVRALYDNTLGALNTATGVAALRSNTTGSYNTATGVAALRNNIDGHYNTAVGFGALNQSTTGFFNTASGAGALLLTTTGSRNTALGAYAGYYNTTGADNIFIGSYRSDLGKESNTLRVGGGTGLGYFQQNRAFISGIQDAVLSGVGEQRVCVDDNDQVGPCSASSVRFKEQVREMGEASSRLLELRPVLFKYKPEFKREPREQFGLIAEEVAEVFPALVSTDKEGRPFSVRYDALTPLLLNELQKQHRRVQLQGLLLSVLFVTAVVLAAGRWRVR